MRAFTRANLLMAKLSSKEASENVDRKYQQTHDDQTGCLCDIGANRGQRNEEDERGDRQPQTLFRREAPLTFFLGLANLTIHLALNLCGEAFGQDVGEVVVIVRPHLAPRRHDRLYFAAEITDGGGRSLSGKTCGRRGCRLRRRIGCWRRGYGWR